MWFIAAIIVIIIIFVSWNARKENIEEPKVYTFGDSGQTKRCGHKIVIIAGVHGNEPAGPHTLMKLIKRGYFHDLAHQTKSKIIVVPSVNEYGLTRNKRWQDNFWRPDINRNFTIEGGTEPTSNFLAQLTKSADLVIDFHEGWGYHKIQNASIGSTISPTETPLALGLARQMISRLNRGISDQGKQFTLLRGEACIIPSAISCFLKSRNYILVETTGQNNIQPMEIREQQILNILECLKNIQN